MSYLETYDAIPDDRMSEKATLATRWVRTEWKPFFKELRERRPIFVTPAFTLVTRFHDVVQVLTQQNVFSVRLYQSKMDPVVDGPFMLARDATDTNWTEKGLMQALLHPADLPAVRRLAGVIADVSLDAAVSQGRIETVSRLGRYVPVRICGEYFGFPGPDVATMMRWSKAFQSDMFKNLANDPDIHAANVQAGQEMRDYLYSLLEEKKTQLRRGKLHPHLTIFDRLVSLADSRIIDLPDDRVVAGVAGLLIGSVETMSQAIVQIIEQLLQRPEQLAQARAAARAADDATFDKLAFEALRFNPINTLVFRLCQHDFTLGRDTRYEKTISPGTVVFACTASGMFDEVVVPQPEEFNADRPQHAYLHFGHGHHRCLGANVAAAVIPEVVKRVIQRPSVRLLEGPEGKLDFQGGPFPEQFTVGL